MPNKLKKEVTYNELYNIVTSIKPLKELKASYAFNRTLLDNEKMIWEVLRPITSQIKKYPKEYTDFISATQNLSNQRTKDLKGAPPDQQASIQAKFKKETEDLQEKYKEVIESVKEEDKKNVELMGGKTEVEFITFYHNSLPDMTASQMEIIDFLIQ
jgi:predicted S18 family serine protease